MEPDVANESVGVITMITYLFFIYLILAIFIERSIEISISILNYIDQKMGWHKYWNHLALKYQRKFDKLYGFQGENSRGTERLFNWILWDIVTEKVYTGGKDIISATSIRFKYFRIISRVFAFLLSLFFAYSIQRNLGVDLITLFEKISGTPIVNLGSTMKIFLTAVLLSVGSEPLHEVITRVETIGKDKAQKKSKTT